MESASKVERAIAHIMRINGTAKEGDLEISFTKCIMEVFDVQKVTVNTNLRSSAGNLVEYVLNTKRPFIDNELSEYSSFTELIGYWNEGSRSCAFVPAVVGGRVVAIIEMLSGKMNSFTPQLIAEVSSVAYIMGLSILYRKEEGRSVKLALYFDSAFNSPMPQLLIADDGTIVKPNAWAMREFGISEQRQIKVNSILDTDIKRLRDRSKLGKEDLATSKVGPKVYALHLSQAGPNINYLHIRDTTETERLAGIINGMGSDYGAGVLLLDKDLVIKFATASLKRIIGYDSTLAMSRSLIDLIPERERGEFKETSAKLEKAGKASGVINLSTDKGTLAPIRFSLTKAADGNTLLFYDATAESYVLSIGNAFNDMLENSSEMAIKVNDLGYITYNNHTAEQLLGYDSNELQGKEIRLIYSDSSILERDMSFARSGGKVDNSYTSFIKKDGKTVIDATNSMRFFRTGQGSEYVIIARELETKRRLIDQESSIEKLSSEINSLRKTGEQKSQFIYNISHELKTPLTNIRGFSKLFYNGEFGPLNPEQLSHIATIIDESDRLIGIIQQILDASKLESAKVKLDLIELDMRELGQSSTIKSLEESARNKGLKFSWDVKYDVPSVLADHSRLVQVFVNLIGNSIKFTPRGGSIEVTVFRKGRLSIECEVCDNGIGINEENRHKLFKKFYEAPKKAWVKQEGSGTGLGLSITREIVKLHGGDIGYEPRESGGSRFWFTLPIKGKRKKRTTAT